MALRTKQAVEEIKDILVQAVGEAGLLVEGSAKDNCPVRTGNLRASINTQVDEEEISAYVGTNVEYAPYVEEGTSSQTARHFLRNALDDNREKIIRHFKGLI